MAVKEDGKVRAQKRIDMEDRRRKVAAMLRLRSPRSDICRQLAISAPTLTRDVKAIIAEWRKERTIAYDDHVATEIAVLADDERRWRQEMIRASQPKTVTRTVKSADGSEQSVAVDVPADFDLALSMYDRVLAIVKRRHALLGVDAPLKVAPVTPEGKALNADRMTDDERLKFIAEFFIAAGVATGNNAPGNGASESHASDDAGPETGNAGGGG